MIGPYELDTIVVGDCLDVMREMPDGSVDEVISDPPYGVTTLKWDCRVKQEWLDEMLRVAQGSVLLCSAARPDIQQHMLSLLPLADRVIIWRQPRVKAGYGMFWSWQPIYCWGADFGGWDTIQFSTGGRYCHPTQKPVALMSKLLDMTSTKRDLIFDPFMGSGTTAVAAKRLGRHYFGCDISEEYVEMARKRVAQIQPDLFSSVQMSIQVQPDLFDSTQGDCK